MAVSSMDQDLEKMLVAMYHEQYLIVPKRYVNDSNYLVYSAKLNCSCGSKPVYLKTGRKNRCLYRKDRDRAWCYH